MPTHVALPPTVPCLLVETDVDVFPRHPCETPPSCQTATGIMPSKPLFDETGLEEPDVTLAVTPPNTHTGSPPSVMVRHDLGECVLPRWTPPRTSETLPPLLTSTLPLVGIDPPSELPRSPHYATR